MTGLARLREQLAAAGMPARIIDNIAEGANGCLVWTGTINTSRRGYGRIYWQRKNHQAHRFVYELLVGSIPPGLVIDHLCRTTACVNPDHLEVVTDRENILRGTAPPARHARQVRCKHGHPFTPENTAVDKIGRRKCRICSRWQIRNHWRIRHWGFNPKPRPLEVRLGAQEDA